MTLTAEERLHALGLRLPAIVPPRGNFRPYVVAGPLLYLSGKGAPLRSDGAPVPKVGAEVTVEQARAHAQEVGLYLLALIQQALGDLIGSSGSSRSSAWSTPSRTSPRTPR